jgi:hypothetical protein
VQWVAFGGLVARTSQRFTVDGDVLANFLADVDEPLFDASS